MSDRKQQDHELIAFTDALLGGNPQAVEPLDHHPLASTVERLARALRPQPVPDDLRRAVRRRIVSEWAMPRPAPGRRFLSFIRQPQRRWAWAAMAAMLVLAVAAASLLGSGAPVTATVAGGSGWIVLIALAVLAGAVAAVWWAARRKR